MIISCKTLSSSIKCSDEVPDCSDYDYTYSPHKRVYLDKNFESNCSIGDIATIMDIITHASTTLMPTNKPSFIENANYEKEMLAVRVSVGENLYIYRFKYKNGKWHLDGIGLLDIYY